MFRIGIGFDAHRFAPGKKLYLGGIEIRHGSGLTGHSDADVLLHAVCDSILGALGRRDIGYYFPDNSEEFKNISSRLLLERVMVFAREDGYCVSNADTLIICEEPRLSPYIEDIKKSLSHLLLTEPGQVGVKATTTEKMGFTGRKEGIAAKSVVLLKQL